MKKRVFNLMILDESGSMYSIKSAAVGGVNETIQTIRSAQKESQTQEHYVSLVTFSTGGCKKIYDCAPIEEVKEIRSSEFVPNGCTPLFDAMGKSLGELRDKVSKEDKVLVTIITDGMENASVEFNGAAIKNLVDDLKAAGWVFVYIGANQDAEAVGASLSIHNTLNFSFSSEGTHSMMRRTNERRRAFYRRMENDSFDSNKEESCFFSED